MRSQIRSRTRCAFTLVEILSVVVILGIAGALIVPQLGSRDDLKAAAAARVVMADLIYAQNTAITTQSNQFVQFSTVAQNYSVLNSTLAMTQHPVNHTNYTERFGNAGTSGLVGTTLATVTLNAGVTTSLIVGFDELGSPLIYPTGGPAQTMTSGSVVIQSGTYKLKIDIEPYTGQLSVTPTE